jgi:bleomycin hydrolase
VGKISSRKYGVMDLDIHDYKLGFDIEFNLSKADRLILGESLMTHAMVFTGVHVVDGKPVRWRVENSWSDTSGEKGFWVIFF